MRRRGIITLLFDIAFVVSLQGIALLGMIAVLVVIITIDLVVLEHAFSLSGLDGRWKQALVLTINVVVIAIVIWWLRQRGKLRPAEQHHAKDYRQQRERAAEPSEEDRWFRRAAEPSEENTWFSRAAEPSEEDTWWAVLEVSRDASANDIRRSYLRKIRRYHPDRVARLTPEVRELAEGRSKKLNAAYAEAMRERRGSTVG
jgi:membrane protein implicated in regulation of membrane protease activity